MSIKIDSNGLKSSEIKALNKLADRRYQSQGAYSLLQAQELAKLSRQIAKQIALLIDRQGRVQNIIIGDAHGILIPELARVRQAPDRLRGLRLLHTHLKTNELLSQEDLMDLLFLRLDSIAVLTVDEEANPKEFQAAHLLPLKQDLEIKGLSDAYMLHPPLDWDKVENDFNEEAKALEEEMSRILGKNIDANTKQRAILLSIGTEAKEVQEKQLEELAELARTANVEVVGQLVQRVKQINANAHIIGKGKLAELEILALQNYASLLIFNGELSPTQLTRLTDMSERLVLDRTQLILDIFANNAKSKAGKLQVEMAQLKYTQPRLSGQNKAMDRLMGGIGGRGPGETKLETDRRKIRDRIAYIKLELDKLSKQRYFTRNRRARQNLPIASLVGYTNAGKSSLLNALTKSEVLVENKLFATLDTSTRRLRLPEEKEIVLADTVGFIRNLPKELVEAFKATLEELDSADLLLHVVDASHPDYLKQYEAVEKILYEMDINYTDQLLIMNKWDQVPSDQAQIIEERFPHAIKVSALTKEGLPKLAQTIARTLTGVVPNLQYFN